MLWLQPYSDPGFRGKPMRGNRQYCLGTVHLLVDLVPAFGISVVPHGVHRIAVPEKYPRAISET
jgi:hypothetical protein